jgi:hypothetical protein
MRTKLTKKQEIYIIKEYDNGTGKFCKQLARELNVRHQVITNCLRRNKVKVIQRWNNGSGKEHPSYKDGTRTISGHKHLFKPRHANARADGWIRESHYKMSKYLKRPLYKNEVVHHIDGDTSNNRISNLQLFKNNGEHIRFHNIGFKRDKYGKFIAKG